MNPDDLGGPLLRWAIRRVSESSTWAGLAMIALTLASEALGCAGLAEAIALIVGGGLVSAGPLADDDGRSL